MEHEDFIVGKNDPILITGAAGFIGVRLVERLLKAGFCNLRCFARPSSSIDKLQALAAHASENARLEIVRGNLLHRDDCNSAAKAAAVVYHLAAGVSEKDIPDAFANSVVTTRNLLDACLFHRCLRRFVNISSFAVYGGLHKPRYSLLNESCPVEPYPEFLGNAYCYAKVKQDALVEDYGRSYGIPFVVVRPGSVYGPGKKQIPGRIGIDILGLFVHLGGTNRIPLTYVDNCADAIMLAGLKRGVDGEVFNVVDDELPSSRAFLRLYKQNVKPLRSFYIPHVVSYVLCALWEKYSDWSEGQLPPVFNRRRWRAEVKRMDYSNEKAKTRLGWSAKVPLDEALTRYFRSCQEGCDA
jgi:nucleoside-diphosphate-sugar epimerase